MYEIRGKEPHGLVWSIMTSSKRKTQAGALAVPLEAPLNKQAGYHTTNIYLTPPQKVLCRPCAEEGSFSQTSLAGEAPASTDTVQSGHNNHATATVAIFFSPPFPSFSFSHRRSSLPCFLPSHFIQSSQVKADLPRRQARSMNASERNF